MPHAIGVGRNLLHASAAEHAIGPVLGNLRLAPELCEVVGLLDEEPAVLAVGSAATAHQVPSATELVALEIELEVAFAVTLFRIDLRDPGAAVPYHDRARTVLFRRDHALEIAVFERMILDVHGEALVVRIEARALRHC